ncbi:MAG: hypothetical protein M0R32_08090 [Candidatus Cloacimonetes bacterium]|jgi:hypothetical protein|nr:hypothetical protein [Candidatus Cloacimonadota bacterium]
METDKEKMEEFVKASEERIYSWAKSTGETIEPVVKTAIYAELKAMYDVGHRHCNEAWVAKAKAQAMERDLADKRIGLHKSY